MRILLVGAGGVGGAVAAIAGAAAVLRGRRRGRLRPGAGRDGGRAAVGDDAVRRRPGRRLRRGRGRRAAGRAPAATHVINADGPAVRDADLRRAALRRGRDYLDMAMSLSQPAPGPAVRADRGQARRRAVRAAPRSGRRAGRLALVGMGVEPGLSDVFARYAADHLFCEIDELGHARRRQPRRRRATTSRPSFSHLDHDRGVPEPAGDLGERPRLVHHRAVQRAGGVRLPGGHRAGRVRERRARGGAADAALGGREAGDLQVRPGRRSSSTC